MNNLKKGDLVKDYFIMSDAYVTEAIINLLLERGYKKENIFILDSDGESPFFPSDGFSGLNSISLLLNSFQNIIENSDTLFVYITGHGGQKDNKSFIILNSSESLYYNKFFDALKKINPKHGIIFNDICFAEIEISNDLCEYIFLTATDKNNTSYGNGFPRTFGMPLETPRMPLCLIFLRKRCGMTQAQK